MILLPRLLTRNAPLGVILCFISILAVLFIQAKLNLKIHSYIQSKADIILYRNFQTANEYNIQQYVKDITEKVTEVKNTTPKIPLYTVRMEEHLKYFKHDPLWFSVCNELVRPLQSDIYVKHNVYQHFKWTTPSNRSWILDMYFLNFYYDDRFVEQAKRRYIRTVITVKGPGNDDVTTMQWKQIFVEKENPYMLLWYQGFSNPICTKCTVVDAAPLVRDISGSGEYYFQYVISCTIPEIGILPVSASISAFQCQSVTNFKDIVYPEKPRHPASRDIGLCMASLYGSLSKVDVPYLTSWFEALHLLGLLEVTMNNATILLKDDMIKALFQYYQDSGFLQLTHYPIIHDQPWVNEDDATESINKVTTSDCFFRKIYKYWFVLIHDIDELVVPIKHRNYVSLLEGYDLKYNNLSQADCLSARSAFFYMDFKTGNPEYPDHLPLHRKTERWEVEPIETDGIGISKSFSNMRSLVAAGHHLCRQSNKPWAPLNQIFLPVNDVIVHHYRNSTKYHKKFREHKHETVHDESLIRIIGPELKEKVEHVLHKIGYL